ncbi:hypothetical protein WA026_003618 [Henosepilachna vigintioctopunctata]|uniref:SHSP domain-containing protein n=1 Tax=Henosepilachna vigintioctopunctata TaxID=420089 RepID=A0AAW1TND0_9CUCU
MPSTADSSLTSCYGKSRNNDISDTLEENKIFKTKVDLLNCRPEDVKLKIEGNRVIIEGKLLNKGRSKEKPTYFSKHYIMPENCDLDQMRYTITPEGVYITAPRRDTEHNTISPKLEENCTTNCVDLKDKFEIRLDVSDFRPEDIKIKVNGNTITIKAKRLQETGMKRVIKTYTLPNNCEITKLERRFTPQGLLLLTVPKFLGIIFENTKEKLQNNVKCKFDITSEKFEIKIDVTNYKQQDINIIQQKRMVTVEGKRCRKTGELERFDKTFVLPPDYDITKIDRKFHADGVLVIAIPRVEGKEIEDFKTFLPENAICDMDIKEDYVEIRLDIVGYATEDITIKVVGKHTITIEGKQIHGKGKINKSFMKSYILPSDCDTKRIKKHITSNSVLVVRVPRSKRTCSLDDLSIVSGQTMYANSTKNGSVDNLSEQDDQAMVDSAELDKEKFEMKFNVQGFQTEDIYVKINKNIVSIECRHPSPGKGIIKSYLVPKEFDLKALQTFITHDDVLVVTIPRLKSEKYENFSHKSTNDSIPAYTPETPSVSKYTNEKIGENYVIKVDIRGYNNNDISLDIEGQHILVQGGHLGNNPISKSFSKKFNIPPNYNVDKLIYYISAGGFLIIEIPNKHPDSPNRLDPKLYTFNRDSPSTPDYFNIDNQDHYKTTNRTNNEEYRISEDSTRQYRYPNNNIVAKECPKKPSRQLNLRKLKNEKYSPILDNMKRENNSGSISRDENGNEVFHMNIDMRDYPQKEIDVKIKGQNLTVDGKSNHYNKGGFVPQTFAVPKDFNMREVKTKFQEGILLIDIPKFKPEVSLEKHIPIRERDILSNVKIGRENIIIEIDSSDLLIEDFEITTNRNLLKIEVLKENSEIGDKFKTAVDLPDDCIIDEITKKITTDRKLLVTVPRKFSEEKFSHSPILEEDSEDEIINDKANYRRSCLVLSKTNSGEKSKSVKFLDDGTENEESSVKFATLPKSAKSKSYNSVFLPESSSSKATENLYSNENFELKIYVPHHEPDEVIVKLRGSTITIEGKKRNDKGNIYFSKNFFKMYTVPKHIDTSQLKTTFLNDYLVITAPKKEEIV